MIGNDCGGCGERRTLALDSILRQGMKTVRERSWVAGEQVSQAGIVGAEDKRTSGLARERVELTTDGFEIRVKVEVFLIDVQNDSGSGVELPQRAVTFVGFAGEKRLASGWCLAGRDGKRGRTGES